MKSRIFKIKPSSVIWRIVIIFSDGGIVIYRGASEVYNIRTLYILIFPTGASC